jgi:hypothetical protein
VVLMRVLAFLSLPSYSNRIRAFANAIGQALQVTVFQMINLNYHKENDSVISSAKKWEITWLNWLIPPPFLYPYVQI